MRMPSLMASGSRWNIIATSRFRETKRFNLGH
jgi:hypothetical protein